MREDQSHFRQCPANEARPKALQLLLKTVITSDGHPYGTAIAQCMVCSLQSTDTVPDIPYNKYPQRYHDLIRRAVEAQTSIGWRPFLRGFLAEARRDLASLHQTTMETDTSRGHHRTYQTLSALQLFFNFFSGKAGTRHSIRSKTQRMLNSTLLNRQTSGTIIQIPIFFLPLTNTTAPFPLTNSSAAVPQITDDGFAEFVRHEQHF